MGQNQSIFGQNMHFFFEIFKKPKQNKFSIFWFFLNGFELLVFVVFVFVFRLVFVFDFFVGFDEDDPLEFVEGVDGVYVYSILMIFKY